MSTKHTLSILLLILPLFILFVNGEPGGRRKKNPILNVEIPKVNDNDDNREGRRKFFFLIYCAVFTDLV